MVRAGTVLAGRYRLEQRIASGGMGEVWRAVDRVLGRTVAVKCLLAADEPSFVDRFLAEARTMATISHPGVVEVYDFGDDRAAGVYLVMKYIDGESLAHTLARTGRLSAAATMRLVAEAAEALHAAHEKGVTHRDVKPGNLLLCPDGSALLTDFGIARSAGHSTTGSLAGTAGYMAPERANGEPATARSDIYSLGVVAYRCLAGCLPFAGDSLVEVALRHVRDEPPPLPAGVPRRVRAVVERAMAKDPSARWPSGAVLAVEARRALAPDTTTQHEATVRLQAGRQPAGTQPAGTQPAGRQPAGRQPGGRQPGGRQPTSGGRRARRLLVPAAAVLTTAIIATVAVILSHPGDPQPQSLQANPDASPKDPARNVGATEAASPGASSPVPSSGATTPAAGPGASKPKAGNSTTPPAAPKNLTATPIDSGTIRLRWSDDSANEDGFTITNGAASRNVGANATAYDWTGLPPATYSCFKVLAQNSFGASAYYPTSAAEWVCATSLPGTGPAAPTNLTAAAVNAGTIGLQWTDVSADEDG
ncbi:MAG TPA: protein kinase, partial [Candidatus Limnocylindrales bacterium]